MDTSNLSRNKGRKSILLFLVLLLNCNFLLGQNTDSIVDSYQYVRINETTSYGYTKPKLFDVITYLPQDLADFGSFLVKKENVLWSSLAVGSTVALIPVDQKLLDNSIELGEPLGLSEDVRYIRVLGVELIPQDINGAIYYIGYGMTPILISAGFYASGLIYNDYRALNTASELIEVLISAGVTTQVIKRLTGRQSPSAAIESGNPGGHWTPFPSFKSYYEDTPNYDAMPSGHVATFMATVTVLAINYPEVKWIKPVGYSLMGLLAFEMMSSRVHWASDYPLAILIGYAIGKNAANRRIHKKIETELSTRKTVFETNYSFSKFNGISVVGVTITF